MRRGLRVLIRLLFLCGLRNRKVYIVAKVRKIIMVTINEKFDEKESEILFTAKEKKRKSLGIQKLTWKEFMLRMVKP